MSTNNNTYKGLHQFDLGPEMSAAEIEEKLRNARGSDVMRAVLQHLRNQASVVCYAGRQPPLEHVAPGDYRAYHDGGADALEEAFKTLWEAEHSGVEKDPEVDAG